MDMSLSKLQELVKDRELWQFAVNGVSESDMTEWLNWTELKTSTHVEDDDDVLTTTSPTPDWLKSEGYDITLLPHYQYIRRNHIPCKCHILKLFQENHQRVRAFWAGDTQSLCVALATNFLCSKLQCLVCLAWLCVRHSNLDNVDTCIIVFSPSAPEGSPWIFTSMHISLSLKNWGLDVKITNLCFIFW